MTSQLAARCDQGHASRIDIAEFANLGINQRAATAVNVGGFFAKHPAGHVEIMNHHFNSYLDRSSVISADGENSAAFFDQAI
jgi:hypothetical protein